MLLFLKEAEGGIVFQRHPESTHFWGVTPTLVQKILVQYVSTDCDHNLPARPDSDSESERFSIPVGKQSGWVPTCPATKAILMSLVDFKTHRQPIITNNIILKLIILLVRRVLYHVHVSNLRTHTSCVSEARGLPGWSTSGWSNSVTHDRSYLVASDTYDLGHDCPNEDYYTGRMTST